MTGNTKSTANTAPPSPAEQLLLQQLRDFPSANSFRYTEQARASLLEVLFQSLSWQKSDYSKLFFPNGYPNKGASADAWNLGAAQGAVEGAEYSPAAKGKACGHIFKSGEAAYRCKTCSHDDTCVLCSKCFESSDHTGHIVFVSISPGNMGCCDCGDAEAWRVPMKCAIHTASTGNDDMETEASSVQLPEELKAGIKGTISTAIDYLCDVISCSPEQLRLPKSEEAIRRDEEMSRLTTRYPSGEMDNDNVEYALILWNDEKHTVNDVEEQVARACKKPKQFANERAREADSIGRSIIIYSHDVKDLLRISKIIEQIKITVTIRSARDTFREQMCGTIIEWLNDLAGGSVGGDNFILRNTICEELLGTWRTGSLAWNTEVGLSGIDDHAYDEEREHERWVRRMILPLEVVAVVAQVNTLNEDNMELDETDVLDDIEGRDEDDGEEGDEQDEHMELDDEELDGPAIILTGDPIPQEPIQHTAHDTSIAPEAPAVPSTPNNHHVRRTDFTPPEHWIERPETIVTQQTPPPYENLRKRVRLDWLILFDLRLWKKARIDLRELYISTVVAIPEFKRILGLRFSSLYTMLSQLYLIADREPDHSIINLTLQILTTPSITAEVVKRGNFLTSLMAILYTFLTTRQVGYPTDINPKASLAFDAGSLANRRMHHFFQDMRYLVGSDYVQERLRLENRYILQFLDLVKLHQGICPNIRAVDQHIEYEAEAWISASLITREMNKLVRLFSEAFKLSNHSDIPSLQRAISTAARYAIADSMGWDKDRYHPMTETKGETEFKRTEPFEFDTYVNGVESNYEIIKFGVDKQPLSFHHALHYTLSWLIEAGKSMPVDQIRTLLRFKWGEIGAPISPTSQYREADDMILAMFDYPLRVCAWLCEMKVGMWVRNGFSLRHQMQTYRAVGQKDLTHNRDIFLLQTALVTLEPSRMLANMIDRFNLDGWFRGVYASPDPWDELQTLDMAEEFLNLLITILCERLCLIPQSEEPDLVVLQLKREITHILCFKPLTFSELAARMPDRLQDLDDFQDILTDMTTYNPPNGLSDSGTFELKQQYLLEVDPYVTQFTKNQREEAEGIYKARVAKLSGRPKADVVFEPKLRQIKSGCFTRIADFTKTPLFAQIVYYSLAYALEFDPQNASILGTRVETYLQVCLHLCLLGVLEDTPNSSESFVLNALHIEAKNGPAAGSDGHRNIASLLYRLGKQPTFKALWPRVFLILAHMRQRRTAEFDAVAEWSHELGREADEGQSPEEKEAERKKKLSKERQEKVMAEFRKKQQSFLQSNAGMDLDEEDFSDEATMDEKAEKCWEYPSGSCSVCKESVTSDDRIYGTFAFITESSILRQTDLSDADYVYEVATSPPNLNEEVSRPYGVASMNRGMVKRLASDGSEIMAERQVLGRGYPSSSVRRGALSTGCGHIIHFACFEYWYESTKRRHPHNIARAHPERFEKKEFICPLCKALGNTFLPIVWKSKPETISGVTHSEIPFVDWLTTTIGPLVSRLEKAVESESTDKHTKRAQGLFIEYGRRNMTENIMQKIPLLQDVSDEVSMLPEGSIITPDTTQADELLNIYRRMRETLRVNNIRSRFTPPPATENTGDLTHCDTLARVLGFSIAAAEIAQRGVDLDDGATLIDTISNQTLVHLRVMAETVFTYYSIGGLQNKGDHVTVDQFKQMQDQQLHQLFFGHQQISKETEIDQIPSLFSQEIFVFLAECSVCLVPSLKIEFHQILQLCYVAEIVKAIIFIGRGISTTLPKLEDAKLQEVRNAPEFTEAQTSLFQAFLAYMNGSGYVSEVQQDVIPIFRNMLGKYALTFLRKAAILVHVRYGVDFTTKGLPNLDDATEHDCLTKALGVPSIEDIFTTCLSQSPGGILLQEMIQGWYGHWDFTRQHKGGDLTLTHPCIFELVGLPLHYDTLVEEAMKRKCPSSGKDLTDPSVCLFCGEIFCSQALCCQKDKRGGCNQHMDKCQVDVGIFINIRKCHVLFLHAGKGAWTPAPYLDKHGETDSGLRRNRQLFLNQRRYDALQRSPWLQHGIPSIISRKLESEVNTGGWETI